MVKQIVVFEYGHNHPISLDSTAIDASKTANIFASTSNVVDIRHHPPTKLHWGCIEVIYET